MICRQPRWQDVFEVSADTAIHSLRLHSMGLAPWEQLGSMCARAFCVSKFEVGGPPRELLAAVRSILFTIEMPPAPAAAIVCLTCSFIWCFGRMPPRTINPQRIELVFCNGCSLSKAICDFRTGQGKQRSRWRCKVCRDTARGFSGDSAAAGLSCHSYA